MIGQSKQRDEPDFPLAPLTQYGANHFYNLNSGWRYAASNGVLTNKPVLNSSNKTSEHNIINSPLTPGIVIKVLPVSKFSKQNGKLRSFPVRLL